MTPASKGKESSERLETVSSYEEITCGVVERVQPQFSFVHQRPTLTRRTSSAEVLAYSVQFFHFFVFWLCTECGTWSWRLTRVFLQKKCSFSRAELLAARYEVSPWGGQIRTTTPSCFPSSFLRRQHLSVACVIVLSVKGTASQVGPPGGAPHGACRGSPSPFSD